MIDVTRDRPTAAQLAALYADAGWVSNETTLPLDKSIANTSVWIVARVEGEVVGVARLQTDYVRYCCVYDTIVRNDHRRRGIGTEIMREALRFCDESEIHVVHLWPTKGAIAFYERFGFQALGPEQPTMLKRTPQQGNPPGRLMAGVGKAKNAGIRKRDGDAAYRRR